MVIGYFRGIGFLPTTIKTTLRPKCSLDATMLRYSRLFDAMSTLRLNFSLRTGMD